MTMFLGGTHCCALGLAGLIDILVTTASTDAVASSNFAKQSSLW